MKTALIGTFAILFSITLTNAQNLSLVTSNKLMITPPYSKDKFYPLSKVDLARVDLLTSNLGLIKSYSLSFNVGGEYFTKKKEGNNLDQSLRDRLLKLETGGKIYITDIIVTDSHNKDKIKMLSQSQFEIVD